MAPVDAQNSAIFGAIPQNGRRPVQVRPNRCAKFYADR